MVEIIAPKISGVELSNDDMLGAHQKIDGGSSVLYDAAAKDFLTDAFAHCMFIGMGPGIGPLLAKTGLAADPDDGCLVLATPHDAKAFVAALAPLRFRAREPLPGLDALAA
ncbi:hypothetical protein [Novosphingobium album (ex Liu et al. 2023)]|uniref:Uncharacterized protein n=1 Tax=Novosphingobium album (ex Liu et al. 2023) TaxID=3031130 RepID=A0ABT5WU67_9SPHN|nr:hypothetical protein [Novosphingobium album (ex Liu et al. 2023)]MDE8653439.1 hypothetical protein [Novosphingobium album (ex Liu et al. 2023)]